MLCPTSRVKLPAIGDKLTEILCFLIMGQLKPRNHMGCLTYQHLYSGTDFHEDAILVISMVINDTDISNDKI